LNAGITSRRTKDRSHSEESTNECVEA
jgi:hypothetical protein